MDLILAKIKVKSLVEVLGEFAAKEMEEGVNLREDVPELAAWHRGRSLGLEFAVGHLKEILELLEDEK